MVPKMEGYGYIYKDTLEIFVPFSLRRNAREDFTDVYKRVESERLDG